MSSLDLRRWREIRSSFDELVELEAAQRHERLAAIAEADPELGAAVAALLEADAAAGQRLDRLDFGVSAVLRHASGSAHRFFEALPAPGTMVAHFRVLEPIGSGGMGAVYRAIDTRLQRVVALKLPLHPSDDVGVKERFLREARLAGGLEHPNLCPVYEAGEAEAGQLYIAMPCYAGQTLKRLLAGGGPLPLARALEVARQAAEGLGFAHAASVIHRDLKPGNLMVLADGAVKVLDFGLAKSPDLSRTASGRMLGTVAYMAPEQLRGGEIDARVDLWALGVILYEMLTGVRPFSGENEMAVAHAIVSDDPPAPSALRKDIPRAVEHLVLSLLQKDPAHRYLSAQRLAADIHAIEQGRAPAFRYRRRGRATRWLHGRPRRTKVAIATAALLVFAGTAFAGRQLFGTPPLPTRSAAAYEFFQRAEDYQTRIFTAQEWNAEWQRAAEMLYQRALEADPNFALAHARLANLRSSEQFNPATRSDEGLERMRRGAEAALAIDPKLGEARLVMGFYWRLKDDLPRALAETKLARKYAPENPETYAALADIYRLLGRWDEALSEMRQAAARDPKRNIQLAYVTVRLRRYEEAVRSLDRMIELAPDDYDSMLLKGNIFVKWRGTTDTLAAMLRRLPEGWDAEQLASHARVLVARFERRPAEGLPAAQSITGYHLPGSLVRAVLHWENGDTARAAVEYEHARATLSESIQSSPTNPYLRISLAAALAGLGKKQAAIAEIARSFELADLPGRPPEEDIMMRAAAVYARLHEPDRAFELLEQLVDHPAAGNAISAALLRRDPRWDALRQDPRFPALVLRFAERERLSS
ncbi:MAG TPA: protein kinase [Longimicrobiales bacterium]|nr:protein kinase [Longimicrobiales bacterium]